MLLLKVHTHTHTHPFNGPLSGTTWVSQYQKGKTNLEFTEARDSEWQWHQLGHMQVCTSLHRQITTPAPHHSVFYRPGALPAAQPTASKHWRHKALEVLKQFSCHLNTYMAQGVWKWRGQCQEVSWQMSPGGVLGHAMCGMPTVTGWLMTPNTVAAATGTLCAVCRREDIFCQMAEYLHKICIKMGGTFALIASPCWKMGNCLLASRGSPPMYDTEICSHSSVSIKCPLWVSHH